MPHKIFYYPGNRFNTYVNALIQNGNQTQVIFNKEAGFGARYKSVNAAPNCILNEGNEAEIVCVEKAGYDDPALWVIAASKVCEGCPFIKDCPAYRPDYADSNNLQINKEP